VQQLKATRGLCWAPVGRARPAADTEIQSPALAAALLARGEDLNGQRVGSADFNGTVVRAAFATQAELDACGVEPGLAFDYDCYVQVGGMFFSPAVVSVEELQRLQEARGTEGMRAVRALDLKERARGAAGMEALAKALPQLSGLQHLHLGGNKLGAAGMEALAKALPQLSGLQHLNSLEQRA
jgi:hypothetical protein